jgi:hypothetical protein
MRPASLVNYRMRAKNRWGWGQWSYPDLVMISASSPDRIVGIQSELRGKLLDIEWLPPRTNGARI